MIEGSSCRLNALTWHFQRTLAWQDFCQGRKCTKKMSSLVRSFLVGLCRLLQWLLLLIFQLSLTKSFGSCTPSCSYNLQIKIGKWCKRVSKDLQRNWGCIGMQNTSPKSKGLKGVPLLLALHACHGVWCSEERYCSKAVLATRSVGVHSLPGHMTWQWHGRAV